MTLHVMLDLETWSSKSNALIVSIGAARFDPLDPTAGFDSFHVAVDPAVSPGLTDRFHIDPATMMWWMHPDRNAARERWVSMEKMDIGTALEGFALWYGTDDKVPVWGNGAAFDNVILSNAYEALNQPRPWSYRADRCYRTLKSLRPEVTQIADNYPGLEGMAHDALYDAVSQAAHMSRIMQVMV